MILTPRQMEIVKLMADGHNSESISNQLDIAQNTVKTQYGMIRRRLRLNSQREIVSWYYRTFWVPRNPFGV